MKTLIRFIFIRFIKQSYLGMSVSRTCYRSTNTNDKFRRKTKIPLNFKTKNRRS